MKLTEILAESTAALSELKSQLASAKIFSAKKKQTMQVVPTMNDLVANSVVQKKTDDESTITTNLKGHKEAVSKAKQGDWIASGADKELYVIKGESFGKLYTVANNVATPSQLKYFVKVKFSEDLNWENKYGEAKSIPANTPYLLMANSEKDLTLETLNMQALNPMAIDSFKKTY